MISEINRKTNDLMILESYGINPDDHRDSPADSMKFPYFRDNLFIDQYLNIHETHQKLVIPYRKLLSSNRRTIDMRVFGVSFNMTPLALLRRSVLGLYLSSKMDVSFENNDTSDLNLSNLRVDGQTVSTICKYRYDGILNMTPQESRLHSILYSKDCKKRLLKLVKSLNKSHVKFFDIIEQALFMSSSSFYLVDFVIRGFPLGSIGIELDGYHHFTESGRDYDSERDYSIRSDYGVKLIRFSNSYFDSLTDSEVVGLLEKIASGRYTSYLTGREYSRVMA